MLNKIKRYLTKRRIEKINRRNIEKNRGEIILRLYFGWQIKIILERVKNLKNHIVGPFKEYWQYMTAVFILIAVVSIGLLLQSDYRAKGATYGWIQNTWSGGADEKEHHRSGGDWEAPTPKRWRLTPTTKPAGLSFFPKTMKSILTIMK
jgi:hypothetical protein